MILVFSNTPLPTKVKATIFLAGPNPRYKDGDAVQQTWRHEVVAKLEEKGFDGHVFIPMPDTCYFGDVVSGAVSDYDHQIEWEDSAMGRADAILMWVDRTKEFPAMTTNIEFGRYLESGRLVYGRPDTALNVKYLDEQVKKRRRPVFNDIGHLVDEVLWRLKEPAVRTGGECLVPLIIWNSPDFQTWYANMFTGESEGNELRGFDIKTILTFNSRKAPQSDDCSLFGYAAHVNIWVAKEQREKSNEWLFMRTGITYVVPYHINKENGYREYVLVREFRSPANNGRGVVYELPGGSSPKSGVPIFQTAMDELREETGLDISDMSRFKYLGARQSLSTYLGTHIHALSVELNDEEWAAVVARANSGKVLGADEGERITLHIVKATEVLNPISEYPVDWVTLGLLNLATQHYEAEAPDVIVDGSDFY